MFYTIFVFIFINFLLFFGGNAFYIFIFYLQLFFIIVITNAIFGHMAFNVQGWRRFASPDKGLRSKTMAGKMWWKKTA